MFSDSRSHLTGHHTHSTRAGHFVAFFVSMLRRRINVQVPRNIELVPRCSFGFTENLGTVVQHGVDGRPARRRRDFHRDPFTDLPCAVVWQCTQMGRTNKDGTISHFADISARPLDKKARHVTCGFWVRVESCKATGTPTPCAFFLVFCLIFTDEMASSARARPSQPNGPGGRWWCCRMRAGTSSRSCSWAYGVP